MPIDNHRRLVAHKTSQSALEYMMIYGWAILIIVIVAVVLYSFGIFTPSSFITPTTTGFSGFQVQAECVSGVGMFMLVSNQLGQPITLTGINITEPNGSVLSKRYDIGILPSGSQIFILIGGCPKSQTTYSLPAAIGYIEVESPLKNNLISQGKLSGSEEAVLSSDLSGLLSNTYAFGTPYIGVSYQTQEYYANGIFLGQVAGAFPSSLSDLNNGDVNCGSPYDTQGYTAIKSMYFTGNTTFSIITNDGTMVFYRNATSSTWTNVFGNTSWKGQSAGVYGPVSATAKAGLYYVVVDWTNICVGGVSAVSIGGAYSSSSTWNVTAWTPANKSVDLLPYSDVESSPALPLAVSVEQTGYWNQSITANSCNSKSDLCTTIFDAFNMRNNTKWWVEYSGQNLSSNSSFISFTTAPGNFSYTLASPSAYHDGCKDSYSTTATGTIEAGSSLPIFYSTSTECFTNLSESGLPGGASWSVVFDGNTFTAVSPNNIVASSPNGDYQLSVGSVTYAGETYYACPSSGYLAAGSALVIDYSTSQSCSDYTSAFYESSLPYGLNWTVEYNGINTTSSSSALSFETSSGAHSFRVYNTSVSYLHSGCTIDYYPSTSTGSLNAGSELGISYSSYYNCTSVFYADGLPAGATFTINYNGTNKTSQPGLNLTFYTGEGGMKFTGYPVSYGGSNYYPCPKNGTLPGGSEEEVVFSTADSCV